MPIRFCSARAASVISSVWAKKTFATVAAKNDFFEKLGRELQPATEERLRGLTAEATPAQILAKIQ